MAAATVFASGGQTPYSYQWLQSGQTSQIITNQPTGVNQVRATDMNGCFGDAFINITSTSPIVATYTSSASQCTAATGSSTLTLSGGQAPYSVTWNIFPSQTGTVLSNMPTGQYSFLATDANGCIRNGVVTIGNVSNLAGSIITTSATCNQSNGGVIFSKYFGYSCCVQFS